MTEDEIRLPLRLMMAGTCLRRSTHAISPQFNPYKTEDLEMQKGDTVLIRARKVGTQEPVFIERTVGAVIDGDTVSYGSLSKWTNNIGVLQERFDFCSRQ